MLLVSREEGEAALLDTAADRHAPVSATLDRPVDRPLHVTDADFGLGGASRNAEPARATSAAGCTIGALLAATTCWRPTSTASAVFDAASAAASDALHGQHLQRPLPSSRASHGPVPHVRLAGGKCVLLVPTAPAH